MHFTACFVGSVVGFAGVRTRRIIFAANSNCFAYVAAVAVGRCLNWTRGWVCVGYAQKYAALSLESARGWFYKIILARHEQRRSSPKRMFHIFRVFRLLHKVCAYLCTFLFTAASKSMFPYTPTKQLLYPVLLYIVMYNLYTRDYIYSRTNVARNAPQFFFPTIIIAPTALFIFNQTTTWCNSAIAHYTFFGVYGWCSFAALCWTSELGLAYKSVHEWCVNTTHLGIHTQWTIIGCGGFELNTKMPPLILFNSNVVLVKYYDELNTRTNLLHFDIQP